MMKTCNVCLRDKPKHDYFRRSDSKDGLQSCCKECHLEKKRRHRADIAGHEAPAGMKRCHACRETKPYPAFRRSEREPDGYRNTCSACMCSRDALDRQIEVRGVITQPNLLDVCDRSDRRAELAEIGGLKGVHEIRSRLAAVRRAKQRNGLMDLSEEALAELLPT